MKLKCRKAGSRIINSLFRLNNPLDNCIKYNQKRTQAPASVFDYEMMSLFCFICGFEQPVDRLRQFNSLNDDYDDHGDREG